MVPSTEVGQSRVSPSGPSEHVTVSGLGSVGNRNINEAPHSTHTQSHLVTERDPEKCLTLGHRNPAL